ncbi:MAG: hypothetical protein KAH06_09055, partial [Desulfobacterales bacterium]|nr:hypothetical protein [Desulfobacterales bacterium]
MKFKRIFLLLVLFISIFQLKVLSQEADSLEKPEVIPMIFPSYAFQWPGGDMVARFGANSTIGLGFLVKTGDNWLIGADVNFIFGNKMKEDSLFQNLLTSEGYIIDQQGQYADLSLFERGFYSSVKLGKIIPIFGSNVNSGLMLLAGAGYLQHKIRIEVIDNSAPQLSGDYKKGY